MDDLSLAFGIMLGYVKDIAFKRVPESSGIRGLNWRLNVDARERESC